MLTDRQNDLLMLLLAHGQMQVSDIAVALPASLATVRRDLTTLERMGRVERQHGAARIAAGADRELAFASREHQQIDAKRQIAAVAAQLLIPHQAIFLDAGTTVLQLAHHIRSQPMPLKVFTNGLAVAQALTDVPDVTLTLLGGRVRSENLSTVGPAAQAMLHTLWCDQLFLGATAIDANGTLSSLDEDEAAINATMISRSASTRVLADHRKFEQRHPYTVATLTPDHTLITDRTPPLPYSDVPILMPDTTKGPQT